MSTQFNAVYRDGAFHPDVPPELPEGAKVRLTLETERGSKPQPPSSGEEILATISKAWGKVKPGPPRTRANEWMNSFMVSRETQVTFVDTSAWYALYVWKD